ncbi:MAG: hypothetical protein H0T62_10240 [Parachlamydiaceae bacterium]|nr:hypothetical protein [Parachlamydiaceae bacterium]
MKWFKCLPFFQISAVAIFSTFMGLMIVVTFVAFNRKSGQTGLDMGKVQKMRYELRAQ